MSVFCQELPRLHSMTTQKNKHATLTQMLSSVRVGARLAQKVEGEGPRQVTKIE